MYRLVAGTIFFCAIFFTSHTYAAQEAFFVQAQSGQPTAVPQNEEILEGRVIGIEDEQQIIPPGAEALQTYQKIRIRVTRGSLQGQEILVENGNLPMANLRRYRVGDDLVISRSGDGEGEDTFHVTDYVRRGALVRLFAVFVGAAVVIGGWQGVMSLAGMGISFFVIFVYILPAIAAGSDPVRTAITGSLAIIPATFLLSHGVNKKTGIAIGGTLVALVVTGVLAQWFVDAARLTGFASEEAGFLQVYTGGLVNIRGLLLGGIIIGVLGVLDDITVSQSAIVEQLKKANPALTTGELYAKAMSVGKDHIASMVNTLVLVYTGAALPLLLLFIGSPRPFSEVVNHEIIADEIVRTLVGSIGLMLAVPTTTLIAALVAGRKQKSTDM